MGVLIRPRPALHANVKSKRVTTPALGPESMFSNFSLASHVEINLCSSQGHAFWESLVQSNGPESLDQSHWSPFSTCRIEGAGSWELCKRLLCSALPGHLPVMQSCCPWSRWARGKHRPSTDLSLPRRRLVNITVDSHTHTLQGQTMDASSLSSQDTHRWLLRSTRTSETVGESLRR